ncbi:unnamed protein product [Linum tenue]|uniref:Uncharacterized protein n=1 Tax=Linum tenue TaxID=586396 RepID=A0AAV0LV31_9ROSI|nr:unnamed protein product [Linum tenue]
MIHCTLLLFLNVQNDIYNYPGTGSEVRWQKLEDKIGNR